MKFRSKIDFNRYLTLMVALVVFAYSLYDVVFDVSLFNVIFLIFWAFLLSIIVQNLFGTYYYLDDNYLLIKSGKKEVKLDYAHLAMIYDTSKLESYSYFALSHDTLGLIYNSHIILISPKDKEGFVNNLVKYIKASN